MADSPIAVQKQERRDLLQQVSEIGREDREEMQLEILAPGRNKQRIYSTVTGEPLDIPEYMLDSTLAKRLPTGGYEFTARREEAPKYVKGKIKCAFHAESKERESGLLAEAGVAGTVCPAGQLASGFAKREHGKHKHGKEHEALEAYLEERKEEERREREDAALEAQRAIADAAIGNKPKASKPS